MDQFVVDVSHISDVRLHDEVVLVGRQGGEHIPAEEVARWAETINYEVTTGLLPRVTRVYLKEGEEVDRVGLLACHLNDVAGDDPLWRSAGRVRQS